MSSEELKKSEVLKQVKELVLAGKLFWSSHSEDRLDQRQISRQEVTEVLLNSQDFDAPPCTETKYGRVVYKFSMAAQVGTKRIGVAASLDPQKKVVILSAWDVNKNGWK